MGAVQRLATVVIVGLVALATVLVLYLADEGNRVAHEQEEQEEAAIERGRENYITLCMQCHGPAGEGAAAAGEAGTSRIGLPIGGDTYATALNQQGLETDGSIWSDPEFGSGVEGRANWIRNRIINGQISSNGTVVMPAFGEDKNGPLNDEQVEELIVFIQHSDWNETYNEAVAEYDGYPTAAPQPTQAGEGDAQPTEATNPDAAAITVTMYDNYFEPATLTIPADQDVTINLVNAGNADHIFRVDALNIESESIPGGGTGSVTINAPAGDHEYRCPVPGHTELGMVGTLTADPNAPAPGGEAAPAETPAPDPAMAEQPAAGGEQPAAGGEQPAAGGEPIVVDMLDTFLFAPAALTIPANTDVVVDVRNVGVADHSFVVEGQDVNSGVLGGGAAGTVTINLPPGTYTYICDVPGHKELGMVGTLTVQ